ncbi:MAG: DUF1579 family protein [Pirellula sp.]
MRLIPFTLAVFIAASVLIAGDDPKRSSELQVLEYLIGDWETVVTVKETEVKATSIQSRKWSRDGKFVLSEELDLSTNKESHFLVTYDPTAKKYRACFMNEGATVPLLGTWDESNKTMTWKSTDIAFEHEGVHRKINDDLVEWTMTVTSPEGKVVLDISAKQTRRKR